MATVTRNGNMYQITLPPDLVLFVDEYGKAANENYWNAQTIPQEV